MAGRLGDTRRKWRTSVVDSSRDVRGQGRPAVSDRKIQLSFSQDAPVGVAAAATVVGHRAAPADRCRRWAVGAPVAVRRHSTLADAVGATRRRPDYRPPLSPTTHPTTARRRSAVNGEPLPPPPPLLPPANDAGNADEPGDIPNVPAAVAGDTFDHGSAATPAAAAALPPPASLPPLRTLDLPPHGQRRRRRTTRVRPQRPPPHFPHCRWRPTPRQRLRRHGAEGGGGGRCVAGSHWWGSFGRLGGWGRAAGGEGGGRAWRLRLRAASARAGSGLTACVGRLTASVAGRGRRRQAVGTVAPASGSRTCGIDAPRALPGAPPQADEWAHPGCVG